MSHLCPISVNLVPRAFPAHPPSSPGNEVASQYRNAGAKEDSVPGHCHIVTIYESGREEDPSDVFLAIINSDEEDANERPMPHTQDEP